MTIISTQEIRPIHASHPLRDGLALFAFRDAAHTDAAEHYQDIALHLSSLQRLFSPPESSPFDADWQATSGIEQILNALKPHRLPPHLRLIISLPESAITEHTAEATQAAIRRYSQAKIQQDRLELASLRWQAIKAFQTGVIFLGICLLISTLDSTAESLPEWMRTLVGEGFLIAGWVSIWHPTEMFLYEWWPMWRDVQVSKKLAEAEIVIQQRAS